MNTITRINQPSVAAMPNVSIGLTTLQGFELAQRAAKCLAQSSIVPKDYQNNLPNCIVALNMAQRINADPLMVMQNLVIVHGRPTWSAQFLIATFNSCGRFSAIRYEFFGTPNTDEWGCRASATELATGEKLTGADITIALAKREGWYNKGGSKWQTMPQQMLQYRAAAWFVRTIAPEISMGLHTAEELHDVYDAEPVSSGVYEVPDQIPIKQENPQPSSPEAVQEAETTQPDQVNPETGEIIDAPAENPDFSMEYEFLRADLADCKTKGDIASLWNHADSKIKADPTAKQMVKARQTEINEGK